MCFSYWDVDERYQQLLAASWRINQGLTRTGLQDLFSSIYVLTPTSDTSVCSHILTWPLVMHFDLLQFFSVEKKMNQGENATSLPTTNTLRNLPSNTWQWMLTVHFDIQLFKSQISHFHPSLLIFSWCQRHKPECIFNADGGCTDN